MCVGLGGGGVFVCVWREHSPSEGCVSVRVYVIGLSIPQSGSQTRVVWCLHVCCCASCVSFGYSIEL